MATAPGPSRCALQPGEYEYKFVVDGQWVADPDNPRQKADPFGGFNSLVAIQDNGTPVAAATAPAARTGGHRRHDPRCRSGGKITVGPPKAVGGGILFTYKDPGAKQVFLAGSFNGWNATEIPLKNDGHGNWSVIRPLDAGSYEYKFVVDSNWLRRPGKPRHQGRPLRRCQFGGQRRRQGPADRRGSRSRGCGHDRHHR